PAGVSAATREEPVRGPERDGSQEDRISPAARPRALRVHISPRLRSMRPVHLDPSASWSTRQDRRSRASGREARGERRDDLPGLLFVRAAPRGRAREARRVSGEITRGSDGPSRCGTLGAMDEATLFRTFPTLGTPRLILRELVPDDAEHYHPIHRTGQDNAT